MKILVISGFLGAGKTTFIKEMVKKTRRDFAILENEYGELGVDGGLLQEAQQDTEQEINIWELTEGCICCSVKSDFATSILTIANTIDPEFLIVEPTGVGKLSNILRNIGQIEYERIQLLAPLMILDVDCFDRDLVKYGDIYQDQMIHASRIILSKTEHTSSDELARITGEIRKYNEEATIETEHYSRKDDQWWENLLLGFCGETKDIQTVDSDAPDLENVGIKDLSCSSLGELINQLERVVRGCYGDVRRAKGAARVGETRYRFDVVDGSYGVTGLADAEVDNAIFIGTDLAKDILREVFSAGNKVEVSS